MTRMAAVAVVIAAVAAATASAEAARGVPTGSLHAPAGPLVFFRTVPNNSLRPLRRVLRVSPRTGRSLPSVTLPRDVRTFVDATQVGGTSFGVWASTRGKLWLGAAGPTGRIARRWPVGRANGFEVRPAPADPTEGDGGAGLVRVSADRRTALLVNGPGRKRSGRYVDLRSGAVRDRQLPRGIDEGVAAAAAFGERFALIGTTGDTVTVSAGGSVVAKGRLPRPADGPARIDQVDLVPVSARRAVVSFTTGESTSPRRVVARYDVASGAITVARTFPDRFGVAFSATPTRFELFGGTRWTTGRIDGGSLRHVDAPGPGPHPPAALDIPPDDPGSARVLSSTTSADGGAFVFRIISYLTVDGFPYSAYEIVTVDVARARVVRRTRFGDDAGGPSPLPFTFEIRIS